MPNDAGSPRAGRCEHQYAVRLSVGQFEHSYCPQSTTCSLTAASAPRANAATCREPRQAALPQRRDEMAKSIRSKVKEAPLYMRQTIGEKVRTKNIEAAAKRLADKKKGRGNTKTLSYIKGALGGAGSRPGRAYYDAIVKQPGKALPGVFSKELAPGPAGRLEILR